ncbi:MAG: beta-ketoacyl-ACP synthase II [Mycobacteriales bacterium]
MNPGQDIRVLVTGVGAVTPVGDDAQSSWEALLAGTSGVSRLDDRFEWMQDLPVKIGAMVPTDPSDRLERVEARNMDRSVRLGVLAYREAWADAGAPECDRERLACVIGTGIGGITTLLDQYDIFKEKGARRVSPFTIPMMMPNSPAATIALEAGAQAGTRTPVSACGSGSEALAMALELMRTGRVDVIIAGSTESIFHPLPMVGFSNMRALSTRNDEPEKASRPWDADRDGFVLAEGAAVLILESEEHAKARGAKVYAELAGAGITSDGYHITAPDPSGRGAAAAMTLAMADAGLAAADIDYINAHGTSTPVGDVAEVDAIKTALGARAMSVPVSSTKSMTGHSLGAAGAIEAVVVVQSIRDGRIHGTINRDKPDEACDLDVVPDGPREVSIDAALSNSFGFGGHNITLAFRRYDG